LGGLEGSGGLAAELRLRGSDPPMLALELREASLRDGRGRFALEGLHGSLALGADSASRHRLAARSLALWNLGLGGWEAELEADREGLRLIAPVELRLAGGRIRIPEFEWRQPLAPERELRFGIEVVGVELAALAPALGWPAFPGTLDGRLPRASYRESRLVLEGGLEIAAFGG
ncbi:MAG: hypothetical protein NZL88_12150, partial [Gaiellaceae bacterium]|nr:hypothetical protein [Gaiellaceae bacterium]